MEITNYIEFKKERDLGSIISDTFKFIRENWKSYFTTVIKITLPVLVLFLLVLGFYFYSVYGMFSSFENIETSNYKPINSGLFGLSYAALILSAIALYVLMVMASLYYIKSYINNSGEVNFSVVKSNVFKNFLPFFGMSILVFLIMMVSAFLCFFPIFYTGVVLSLAAPIMVFEGKGAIDSIGHSFTLIKDNYWNTLGVLFVVGLLVYLLSLSFSIPGLIYYFIKLGTSFSEEDPTAVFGVFKDPVYFILNIIGYIGQFILSSVTIIASVFIYYDLNEQKNFTGTIEKIDSIGQ